MTHLPTDLYMRVKFGQIWLSSYRVIAETRFWPDGRVETRFWQIAHCDLDDTDQNDTHDTDLNDTHDTASLCPLQSCAIWSKLVQ